MNNEAFAPTAGIQELSFDEIEQVYVSGPILLGICAVAVVVLVCYGAYQLGRSQGYC